MFTASPSRKHAIADGWLALTLQTYPKQSRQFLQGEKDPFRNPVGQTLRTHLPALVDELFGDMDPKNVARALEDLMRMRAVQSFTASEALSFVFALKTVVRKELPANEQSRIELEDRIDEMALSAFDLFLRCRERIYEIRADEAKRRVAMLEKIHWAAER